MTIMTEKSKKDTNILPSSFKDALKLTPLPIYPLQIVSQSLASIQISSDPEGLKIPELSYENDIKLTDYMRNLISSQDVSFLSFDLPQRDSIVDIDKSQLSTEAISVFENCSFPLQSAGKSDLDNEEMFPKSSGSDDSRSDIIVESDIGSIQPGSTDSSSTNSNSTGLRTTNTNPNDSPRSISILDSIIEDRESKQSRIKSEFTDLLELILLKDETDHVIDLNIYTEINGRKVLSLSTLTDLSRLIHSYKALGSPLDLTVKDDIDELCRDLITSLLEEELLELSLIIENQVSSDHSNFETIQRCLKTLDILSTFLVAELNLSQSVTYLEDTIINVCTFLMKFVYKIIIPASTMEINRSIFIRFSEKLQGIVQEFADILMDFRSVINQERFPEIALTKLEFISIDILFVPSPMKNRIIFIKESMFHSLKVTCMDLISCIYEHHRTQRPFIMDQVLNDIERLGIQDASNRNVKIIDGLYVQPLSALLLSFVQLSGRAELPCFDEQLEKDKDLFIRNSVKSVRENDHKASMNCNLIISHILGKISNMSVKTGESPFQTILGSLADDLISFLFIPSCPAAELMLTTMVWKLVDVSNMDGDTPTSALALELLGRIASGLPMPRFLSQRQKELFDLDEQDFEEFVQSSSVVCGYLKKNVRLSSSYQYFTTRFLSDLDSMTMKDDENEKSDDEKPVKSLAMNERSRILIDGYSFQWTKENSTANEVTEAYKKLISYKPISNCYDTAIRSVVYSLDSNRVNKRSKALKAISLLMQKNLNIFSLKSVQESLCDCIVHNSISIREVAVDIVGKFLLLQQQFIPDLYQLIYDRSNDKGIAVRKRILKIIREIYKITDDTTIKVAGAECVLRRLEDIEPSILSDAMNILFDMIFTQYESIKMLEFLIFLYKKNSRLLGLFFSKCLDESGEQTYPLDKSTIRNICESAISDAIDGLSLFEDPSDMLNVLASMVAVDGSLIKQDQLSDLEFYMDPNYSHLDTVIYPILVIMRSSIEHESNLFSPSVLSSLQELLLQPMVQYGLKELQESARTLAAIAHRKNDNQIMASVLSSCLDALARINKSDSYQKTARVIYLTSYLARYCKEDASELVWSKGRTLKSGIKHYVITHLTCFVQEEDSRLRRLAIRSIGNICLSSPSLFFETEVLSLMDKVMGLDNIPILRRGRRKVHTPSVDIEEQDAFIKVLLELLTEEEKIIDRSVNKLPNQPPTKKRKIEKWSTKIDVQTLKGTSKSAAREGAAVGLVQRYMEPVLSIAMRPIDETNLVPITDAIKLIRLVCRQGFAHPRSCVGVAMAVGCSKSDQLSSIARDTLAILYSKYRSVIEGCYVDSIKTVYEYRRSIEPDTEKLGEESLTVFYSVVKESKSFRQKFFTNVIKSLEFDPFRTDIHQLIEHLKYTIFICTAISDLPLMTYGEVLAVIKAVEWHMIETGTELWNRIEEEDEQEPDESVGVSAGILTVLWRLRIFISESFNVSEDRIQRNETGKLTRETKVSTRNSSAEPFTIQNIPTDRGLDSDLQRIEAFRQVMEQNLNMETEPDNSDDDDFN